MQLSGMWALDPITLQCCARHQLTGELRLDGALQLLGQGVFNSRTAIQFLRWRRRLLSIWLGRKRQKRGDFLPTRELERRALERRGVVLRPAPPRYRGVYLRQLCATTSCGAGYYSYLWFHMLVAKASERRQTKWGANACQRKALRNK